MGDLVVGNHGAQVLEDACRMSPLRIQQHDMPWGRPFSSLASDYFPLIRPKSAELTFLYYP
jgi:hypothetical protein